MEVSKRTNAREPVASFVVGTADHQWQFHTQDKIGCGSFGSIYLGACTSVPKTFADAAVVRCALQARVSRRARQVRRAARLRSVRRRATVSWRDVFCSGCEGGTDVCQVPPAGELGVWDGRGMVLTQFVPTQAYEAKLYQVYQGRTGIPTVFHFGKEHGKNTMVMQLCGKSLEDLFQACGCKFSLKTVLKIADEVLLRLKLLHSKGFLHRDIKPGAQRNVRE